VFPCVRLLLPVEVSEYAKLLIANRAECGRMQGFKGSYPAALSDAKILGDEWQCNEMRRDRLLRCGLYRRRCRKVHSVQSSGVALLVDAEFTR
jgi:hypothetical protein